MQRDTLFGGGAAIHNQHGAHFVDGLVHIAQRVVGANDSDYGKALQIHSLPLAGVDLPTENGFFAGHFHFAIGKAGAGKDIGGAGFNVGSGDAARRNAFSEQSVENTTAAIQTDFIPRFLLN